MSEYKDYNTAEQKSKAGRNIKIMAWREIKIIAELSIEILAGQNIRYQIRYKTMIDKILHLHTL
jgi:hypothetical protein